MQDHEQWSQFCLLALCRLPCPHLSLAWDSQCFPPVQTGFFTRWKTPGSRYCCGQLGALNHQEGFVLFFSFFWCLCREGAEKSEKRIRCGRECLYPDSLVEDSTYGVHPKSFLGNFPPQPCGHGATSPGSSLDLPHEHPAS